jgi:hypothetical protein
MMKPTMDEIRLVRPFLDSLTTQELIRLADNYGIDIPPNLERIFVIEELLDYARGENSEREGETQALVETTDLETAPIPRQYNITFIDVMIRDPLWAFVFWEIKAHDKDMYEKDPLFSGYVLRVNPMNKNKVALKEKSFTVPVESNDTARYLGFRQEQDGCFQVELCVTWGEKGEVLAASRTFCLPKLPDKAVFAEEYPESQVPSLPILSGVNDFRILRDADSQTRPRFSDGESG